MCILSVLVAPDSSWLEEPVGGGGGGGGVLWSQCAVWNGDDVCDIGWGIRCGDEGEDVKEKEMGGGSWIR